MWRRSIASAALILVIVVGMSCSSELSRREAVRLLEEHLRSDLLDRLVAETYELATLEKCGILVLDRDQRRVKDLTEEGKKVFASFSEAALSGGYILFLNQPALYKGVEITGIQQMSSTVKKIEYHVFYSIPETLLNNGCCSRPDAFNCIGAPRRDAKTATATLYDDGWRLDD